MDKKMEQIFAPLREALHAQQYTDIDLLSIIGHFAADNPKVAHALSLHSRDFLMECNDGQQEVSYSEVMAEAYRRTFFDAEAAALYGTEQAPAQGEEALRGMVIHLVALLGMDEAQDASGFPPVEDSNPIH